EEVMLKKIFTASLILVSFSLCSDALAEKISLPIPQTENGISVRKAIHKRRSERNFTDQAITLEDVSQLLWAAGGKTVDGVTGPTRAYPSAGGTYPLEIYIAAGNVEGLEAGLYHYDWKDNSITLVDKADLRSALASAAYGQKMIQAAPATIVITAVYERTTSRYGERGRVLLVPMDAGHLGQNVHMEALNLGLGTVMVAGFKEEAAKKVLKDTEGTPIYMMPVGHPEE
ncbi:SagB/ThcOx family dehydrogenase, partial [Candidatus Omnitrophota bacterium]